MTCPIDYSSIGPNRLGFYDLSVGRTIHGDLLYDAFYTDSQKPAEGTLSKILAAAASSGQKSWSMDRELFWRDPVGRERARLGLPVQVFSCWNGGIVVSADPFYKLTNLRFRRNHPGECSESECSHFTKDLWVGGYGRIMVAPTVAVAYSLEDFKIARTPWEQLRAPNETMRYAHYLNRGWARQGLEIECID